MDIYAYHWTYYMLKVMNQILTIEKMSCVSSRRFNNARSSAIYNNMHRNTIKACTYITYTWLSYELFDPFNPFLHDNVSINISTLGIAKLFYSISDMRTYILYIKRNIMI